MGAENPLPREEVWRVRLAIGLLSGAIVVLELAFIRGFAIRFWQHFAHMVLCVAMLGYGASGTILALARERLGDRRERGMFVLALGFAVAVPLCLAGLAAVPLNPLTLAWDPSQVWNVLLFEIIAVIPFLCGSGAICLGVMADPGLVGGHYAAGFLGSGLGAVGGLQLLYVLSPDGAALASAWIGLLGGGLLLPTAGTGRGTISRVVTGLAAGVLLVAGWQWPGRTPISEYKALSLLSRLPGVTRLAAASGPLGRIDVLTGEGIHYAPGLSLQCQAAIPSQSVLLFDGDQPGPIYDCREPRDREFLDFTTSAVAYHLMGQSPKGVASWTPTRVPSGKGPRTLIVGAGGGADIEQAVGHGSREIVALEMNAQVIDLMRGPLADRGGRVYSRPEVVVVNQEARAFLGEVGQEFDLIQVSLIDSFGLTGGGLQSGQEAYLFTVEAMGRMLDRLGERGVLSISRWADLPPRDALKIFDTMARALRARHLPVDQHLIMIRSWATVTVLGSRSPFGPEEVVAIRSFCTERGFDLCFLPGLTVDETNRFHRLDRPVFWEAAQALAGSDREAFLAAYPFQIEAATDDRPYFYHFFRASTIHLLRGQVRGRDRAFVELGSLLMVFGLAQVVVLSGVMILLPLALWARSHPVSRWDLGALGYFLALGAGYMLIEMGFLQKLGLYLGHPVYSAAAVISGFLLFSGLGSLLCARWPWPPRVVGVGAAAFITVLVAGYLLGLDSFLTATHGAPRWLRFLLAQAAIAPLAVAMGHLFPLGFGLVLERAGSLAPWAWGVNGVASVLATVAAPLLAMQAGFICLVLIGAACYFLAGAAWASGLFGEPGKSPRGSPPFPSSGDQSDAGKGG